MIKRLLFSVVAFVMLAASPVKAMQGVGEWYIYPMVGSTYEKVIDTPDMVYFLSLSSLFSFNKLTNETYFYNVNNKLSGTEIDDIYYYDEAGCLLIIYKDHNMDLLYDDGSCYALSDLKSASITDDKSITGVAFGGGRIAISTRFGILVYDEARKEVIESGIYRQPIEAIAICGDKLIIYTQYSMLWSNLTDRHNSMKPFTFIEGMFTDQMLGINDNTVAWVNKHDNCLMISVIDFENSTRTNDNTHLPVDGKIIKCKEGFYIRSGNTFYQFNNKAEIVDQFTLPENFVNTSIGFYEGKESVWAAGPDGIANFDFSASTPTVLADWYKPEAGTCKEIVQFFVSNDGERIYVNTIGSSIVRTYLSTYPDGVYSPQFTDMIEDGHIRDVSILNASATTSFAQEAQQNNHNTAMYGGVTRLVEDPLDPETYYIGNALEGLYVVKNREEIWKFDIYNSPFYTYWNTRIYDVNFDRSGNLWVGHAHNSTGFAPYCILPASKLRQDFNDINKRDWVWPDMSGFNPFSKDFTSLFCKKSNVAFFFNGAGYDGLYVMKSNGDFADVARNKCYNFKYLVDQDGGSQRVQYIYSFVEDKNGRVWIGTDQGLVYFDNPATIDENTTVIRPKVPRNDGTNYADYLLDAEQIYGLAVDPSNRKWVATGYSGVYLVSASGDKILQHFDTSNSPLPENRVTAVACDPLSNTVYFGTTKGLYSYKSNSSPVHTDYNDIYAYPNPVRPDYTGLITVTGLMSNSLVKIADISGNVFFQGRSEGGMITWDGCNQAGQRVKSGIYYVYVSHGTEGQNTSGAVTKIMIIN